MKLSKNDAFSCLKSFLQSSRDTVDRDRGVDLGSRNGIGLKLPVNLEAYFLRRYSANLDSGGVQVLLPIVSEIAYGGAVNDECDS